MELQVFPPRAGWQTFGSYECSTQFGFYLLLVPSCWRSWSWGFVWNRSFRVPQLPFNKSFEINFEICWWNMFIFLRTIPKLESVCHKYVPGRFIWGASSNIWSCSERKCQTNPCTTWARTRANANAQRTWTRPCHASPQAHNCGPMSGSYSFLISHFNMWWGDDMCFSNMQCLIQL